MITLNYPNSAIGDFIVSYPFIVGPLSSTGTLDWAPIDLEDYEIFMQSRGIYGENGVEHVQYEGYVNYTPHERTAVSSPTVGYPDRMKIPFGLSYQYASCGFASLGITKMTLTGTTYTYQYTPKCWTTEGLLIYGVSFFKYGTQWRISYVECVTLKPTTRNSGSWTCKRTEERYFPISPVSLFAGGSRLPDGQVEAAYNYVKDHGGSRSVNITNPVCTRGSNTYPVDTPAQVYTTIYNQLIASSLKAFCPKEADYGDLAMSATEQVNATRTNVIAFVRDFRHPTDMIPKLLFLGELAKRGRKKLRRTLRSGSSDYLSVVYGLLPTVSDLKNIISSVRRLVPYLDKNGFTTHQSKAINSKVTGIVTNEIEQHLKVGIANEDNGFEAICERFEQFGILPSFEFLWDLVPYSFVLDWFADVGSLLARVDTQLRLIRLNIRYVTMSRKHTTTLSGWLDDSKTLYGRASRVHYHRWVTDHCPVPSLSLSSPLASFNHWLEGGALILQRAKIH